MTRAVYDFIWLGERIVLEELQSTERRIYVRHSKSIRL